MGEFPATANVVACTLAVASVCLVVELGYLSHELALLCLWFHACACVCIDFDEHDTENSSPPGVIVNPKGSPKMESGELRNTGAPKQEKKSQGPIADKVQGVSVEACEARAWSCHAYMLCCHRLLSHSLSLARVLILKERG